MFINKTFGSVSFELLLNSWKYRKLQTIFDYIFPDWVTKSLLFICDLVGEQQGEELGDWTMILPDKKTILLKIVELHDKYWKGKNC